MRSRLGFFLLFFFKFHSAHVHTSGVCVHTRADVRSWRKQSRRTCPDVRAAVGALPPLSPVIGGFDTVDEFNAAWGWRRDTLQPRNSSPPVSVVQLNERRSRKIKNKNKKSTKTGNLCHYLKGDLTKIPKISGILFMPVVFRVLGNMGASKCYLTSLFTHHCLHVLCKPGDFPTILSGKKIGWACCSLPKPNTQT